MSAMPKILVLAGLSLVSAGCVFINADVAPYQTFQPIPVEIVEVFTTGLPETDFDEVGLIEISGNYWARYPAHTGTRTVGASCRAASGST